jgi:hypothetical protein
VIAHDVGLGRAAAVHGAAFYGKEELLLADVGNKYSPIAFSEGSDFGYLTANGKEQTHTHDPSDRRTLFR